jgi:hypothetical protein
MLKYFYFSLIGLMFSGCSATARHAPVHDMPQYRSELGKAFGNIARDAEARNDYQAATAALFLAAMADSCEEVASDPEEMQRFNQIHKLPSYDTSEEFLALCMEKMAAGIAIVSREREAHAQFKEQEARDLERRKVEALESLARQKRSRNVSRSSVIDQHDPRTVYSREECIGPVIMGQCHGSILPRGGYHEKCYGTWLNGKCIGPQF